MQDGLEGEECREAKTFSNLDVWWRHLYQGGLLRFFIGIQSPFHRQLIPTLFNYPKNYITLSDYITWLVIIGTVKQQIIVVSHLTLLFWGNFQKAWPKEGILMVNSLTQANGFNKKNSSYLADG